MLPSDEIKKKVGTAAADFVQPGMIIGLGTGSTAFWLIQELGKRARQGLDIKVVPTSTATAALATEAGITLTDLDHTDTLPLTIDGADEIDPFGQLIKGGGGALLQEKIVAAFSKQFIVIADDSKMVLQLGRFPLPVEVVPFGERQVQQRILASGYSKRVHRREKNGEPFITDHGHHILDCECEKIEDASLLNSILHHIPGVVETGLFIHMATLAMIGHEDGRIERIYFKRQQD